MPTVSQYRDTYHVVSTDTQEAAETGDNLTVRQERQPLPHCVAQFLLSSLCLPAVRRVHVSADGSPDVS